MDNRKFTMSEPASHDTETRYAFRLQTSEKRLFRFVRSLICVQSITMTDKQSALVRIADEYDADEAWHYIRSELEYEANEIVLDKIWEDALWL